MSQKEEPDIKDHKIAEIMVEGINSVHTEGEILILDVDQETTITMVINILDLLFLGKHRKEVTEIFIIGIVGDHPVIDIWKTTGMKKEMNTLETMTDTGLANARNVVNQIIIMRTAGLIKQ